MLNVHAHQIFDENPDQLRDFTYLREGCFAEHLHDDIWNLGQLPSQGDD